MVTTHYVALLRGINVGGRNRVAMADLRAAFSDEGYGSVSTYIQSGNVLFAGQESTPEPELETSLEDMLQRRLGLQLVVLVRAHGEMRRVVAHAPSGFGGTPQTHHSDVVFVKPPLTTDQAMSLVSLREGVDQAWPGVGVLYFQRLSARRAQSRMSTIAATPEYRQMSIRNWATTTRLLALLDALADRPDA